MQSQSNYSYQQQRSNFTQSSSAQGGYGGQTSSPAILVNSGLTDQDGARQVAKRILDTYDRDRNGVIDSI
jgi:hypothetical protein